MSTNRQSGEPKTSAAGNKGSLPRGWLRLRREPGLLCQRQASTHMSAIKRFARQSSRWCITVQGDLSMLASGMSQQQTQDDFPERTVVPKSSFSYPLPGRASRGLNGPIAGAILSLT